MTYTEAFEECWKIYPARNGKKAGKKQAFDQWKKLTNGDHRVVKTDLKNRLKDSSWKAGDYVPDMVRYLRHRRWEDETPTPEHEPRPNTYTPPPKIPRVNAIANRVMVHVLTAVGGVDRVTLKTLYRQMKNTCSEYLRTQSGEDTVTKEWVAELKDELLATARNFDGEARAREIEDAKAAFRVRQGVTP